MNETIDRISNLKRTIVAVSRSLSVVTEREKKLENDLASKDEKFLDLQSCYQDLDEKFTYLQLATVRLPKLNSQADKMRFEEHIADFK